MGGSTQIEAFEAFWNIALCSLVETGRLFRSPYCLHPRRQPTSRKKLFPVSGMFARTRHDDDDNNNDDDDDDDDDDDTHTHTHARTRARTHTHTHTNKRLPTCGYFTTKICFAYGSH